MERGPHTQYLYSMWSPRPGGGYGGGGGAGGGQAWQRLKGSFRRLPRVVRGLVILQVALYLFMLVISRSDAATQVAGLLSLQWHRVLSGWVWQLVTYLPFHFGNDPLGVIFDVVILWSVGGMFAERWRSKHFLFFYTVSGIGAGLVHVLLAWLAPTWFAPVVFGWSGGAFALFVAFYFVFGESLVSLFGSQPFKGKYVFYGLVGLETVFFIGGVNPHFAVQMGGVLMGWLLVTGRWRPAKFKAWVGGLGAGHRQRQREQRKSRFRVIN